MKGILARKLGMTRVVDPETGKMTPVTVLEVPENEVLQCKSEAKDGYDAIVLGAFERKNFGKNINKKFKCIKELHVDGVSVSKGDKMSIGALEGVTHAKVTGVSKGKGFSGVIKRHNFSRGPETHGSHHHREPGSVGTCAKPARIIKGKKMPGRYGGDNVTLRSVRVMQLDMDRSLVALKGAVPGPKNGFIFIREA